MEREPDHAERDYIRAVFEKAPDGGWYADAPEFPGCSVKAATITQARDRLRSVLMAHVDSEQEFTLEESIRW